MTPQQKVSELLRIVTLQNVDSNGLFKSLDDGLNRYLTNLTNDPFRDIDRVDMLRDPGGSRYFGFFKSTCRLLAGLMVDESKKEAEVLLIATKGSTEAGPNLFSHSGPEIGNKILVARLLHVAVFTMRSSGIAYIRNDPADDRVRGIYIQMGFVNGEILDLSNASSLIRTFEYIERVYSNYGLNLALPPMPL